MGDGGQVQAGIGGPAGAGHNTGRIFQALARHDIAGADVAFQQRHHRTARGLGILIARFIGRGHAAGIHQRKADRLGYAGHGVGGKLAATGPRRRAGHAFQHIQRLIRHLRILVPADRFEHVLHRQIARAEIFGDFLHLRCFAWQDRATIDKDRGHIQAHHGHHHAWQRFITARQAHNRVIAMAAHCQFYGVGNRLARGQRAAHALVAHGDTIGDSDGGKFTRCAQRLFHAHLDGLRLTVQRNVTGRRLVPAGGHTHQRLVNFFLGHAHRIVIRPMRCAFGPFGHVSAGQLGFIKFRHGGLRKKNVA